ncbi:hypothetical protein [Halorussus lipolyticus]|uniref:hypothetical protein n=1 Tax=Halorussus lipolyticus TaxID=3034024 RepID=UPI0023E82F75|nr:hypothetical protein [Halorussus sp. DT80]
MRRRSLLALAGTVGIGVVGSVTDALPVFSVSSFAVSTEKAAPEHRWVLTVTERYAPDERESIDGEVVDLADLDAEMSSFLRAAVSDDDGMTQRAGRDELPDGLSTTLDRYEAVTGFPDTEDLCGFELWRRDPNRAPALAFDAELVDDRIAFGNPGRIELSVRNRSDERQSLFTGRHPPFGHQWAERTDTDRFVHLWHPDSPFGHLDPLATSISAVGMHHPVEPGQTQTQAYELRAGDRSLAVGEYEVTNELDYRPADAPWSAPYSRVEWRVGFELGR